MPLGKSPARAKVNLIAWDPESPAHIERMVQQRIACGWKIDYVERWRVLQREGKMAIQWIVSQVTLFCCACKVVCCTSHKKRNQL